MYSNIDADPEASADADSEMPVLICLKTETSIPAQMIFYLAMTLPIVKESIENAKNLK